MKHLLNLFFIYIVIFTIVYLLGSFANASFNLNDWDSEGRVVVSICAGVLMAISSMAYAMHADSNSH